VEGKVPSPDDLRIIRSRLDRFAGGWLKLAMQWGETSTSDVYDDCFQYLAAYMMLRSSEQVETLTKRLNNLTIVLIAVTVALAGVAVGQILR
jgi:hypothetical protein